MSKIIYCNNDECQYCHTQSKNMDAWVCKAQNIRLDAMYGNDMITCKRFKIRNIQKQRRLKKGT